MSDSEHSSITYTSVPSPVEDYLDIGSPKVDGPLSPNYMPGLEEPEQAPPEDNFDPNEDLEEDDDEDPEEDLANYPADSTVVALPVVDHVSSEEKRLRFASPTPSQEVGVSSAAGAARQNEPAIAKDDPYSLVREELYEFVDRVDVAPEHPMSKELGYGIMDTWDELVGASKEIAPTTLQGVNKRVTDLSTIIEQETTIMYGMMEEAQDDRSQLRGRVNLLYRDIHVHRHLVVMIEREARMAREA
uniref:Uncharacterized protein n=1 Tax=Tanacetum cinerariifolium TaxID=118510 RepID=A0A6L2M535_TANCI|nr:hypothetical protein [Tanacetum cinerariifolium]